MSEIIDRFNAGVDFEELYRKDIALKYCVLHVLKDTLGHENRLRGDQFVARVQNLWYWKIDKKGKPPGGRKIRDTLCQLRQEGLLVVSTGGRQGGYWRCDSFEELKVFVNGEFRAKSMSMLFSMKQMLDSGRREFGGQMGIWEEASKMSRRVQSVMSLLGK